MPNLPLALTVVSTSLFAGLGLLACAAPPVADGGPGTESGESTEGSSGDESTTSSDSDESSSDSDEGSDSSSEDDTGGPLTPLGLPRLDAGAHLGMIIGFNPSVPEPTGVAMDLAWDEALAHGMDVGRIQISWAELEATPGIIDVEPLVEELDELDADGLQAFVTLETLDSDSLELPSDLLDPDDPGQLAPGLSFDDPEVTARFAAVLDVVVPVMQDHGVFALSVANEPGTLLDDEPDQTGAVVGFLAAARVHVRTLDPELPVAMTMRESEIGTVDYLEPVLSESDFASINFYCQRDDLTVDPLAAQEGLAAILDAAGELEIVLQELGCPAGYEAEPSTIESTSQLQLDFYTSVTTSMATEPRLRAAFGFQLVDWSPEGIAFFEPSLEGAPQWFIDRFVESLATIGLLRYADGTSRPAWAAFLAGLDGLG